MKNGKYLWFGITGVVVVIFVVILVVAIQASSRNDQLTKIDNFDEFYYGVPQKTRSTIFSTLYLTITNNLGGEAPVSGALIRGSSPITYMHKSLSRGYSGSFIVDIPSIKQSYLVEFGFPEFLDGLEGGYAALVYCLDESEMIYPDFGCKSDLPFYTDSSGQMVDTGDENGK